ILVREHIVRKGDTLASIARKYGTTVAQISSANTVGKAPVLKVGQSLAIPISGVTPPQLSSASKNPGPVNSAVPMTNRSVSYTVRSGDTLAKIAEHFNTSTDKLKSWNHLTSARLAVGRKLLVSPTTAQAAAPNPKKVIHQVKQGETLNRI